MLHGLHLVLLTFLLLHFLKVLLPHFCENEHILLVQPLFPVYLIIKLEDSTMQEHYRPDYFN